MRIKKHQRIQSRRRCNLNPVGTMITETETESDTPNNQEGHLRPASPPSENNEEIDFD